MEPTPPCQPTTHGSNHDQLEGVVVERHHPFGVELAERDFQPGALTGDLVDAVEFEVEQLTDPQTGGARQEERDGAR